MCRFGFFPFQEYPSAAVTECAQEYRHAAGRSLADTQPKATVPMMIAGTFNGDPLSHRGRFTHK